MNKIIKIVSLSLLLIVTIFGIRVGNVNAQALVCPVGYTCTPIVGSTNGILLKTRVVGNVNTKDSYQINLSFLGGTETKKVSNWKLELPCNTSQIDITTVPGASCGTFEMGSVQNNGNVVDKEFYFKNSSGVNQTIYATLSAYDSSKNVMGISHATLIIPPTTKGTISWSQVKLNTPNGGETFITGKQIYVVWNTESGTFNLKPDSRTQIYLLKGNTVVANYDYLANDGAEYITIPSNLPSGNDYKVSVTVYSKTPEGGQSDDSDGTFTINLDNPTCATEYPGFAGSMVKNLCGVINSTSNTTVATAYLLNTFDDKAGIWDKFSPGIGNYNKSNSDWNWYLNLNVPTKHSDIASITITNDTANEGWSTSVSDVKGRAPYPLVVFDDSGKQLNTKYDQVIKFPDGANGSYSYKLYGQMESDKFSGGTLTIRFTDNTTTSSYIYSSNNKPVSAVQTMVTVPGTSVVSPIDAKVKISDVSIYDNGKKLTSPISLVVGKRYTITWSAQDVPSSGGFYVVMQSTSRPDLYGVITRRILASSVRSYDWTPTSKTDTDFKIGITNGDTRAYSQSFKVYTSAQVVPTPSPSPTPTPYSSYLPYISPKPSPTPTPTPYSDYKPVVSPTPTPSVTPAPNGVYPTSGLPGSSVTFVVPNTNKVPLTYGDFNFGNYGLLNFKIIDYKTVTFTVPYEAKAGQYEVVWFGGNSYTAKYTVLAK